MEENSESEPDFSQQPRTEYALSRPVRQNAVAKEFDPIATLLNEQDGHMMIPCGRYQGTPGSGDPLSQPFHINIHKRVLAMLDLHSHLLTTEVIGFLAGTWHSKSKCYLD